MSPVFPGLILVSSSFSNFSYSVKSVGDFSVPQKSPTASTSTSIFHENKQNFVIGGKIVVEMHGSRTLLRMKAVPTGDNDTSSYQASALTEFVPSAEHRQVITEFTRRKLPFL